MEDEKTPTEAFERWVRFLPETRRAIRNTRKYFGNSRDIATNEHALNDLANALQIRVFEAHLRDHGLSIEDQLGELIVGALLVAVDLEEVARRLLSDEED